MGKIYCEQFVCVSVTDEPRPQSAAQGVSCGHRAWTGFELKSLQPAQTGLACDKRGGELNTQVG